jgi:hypothetical protein
MQTLLPDDDLITEFRRDLFEQDLEMDPDMATQLCDKSYWDIVAEPGTVEDCYKFSQSKWNRTQFANIEAIIEDGRVVGISGSKMYGPYLRTSMHLYLLKRVRSRYPGIKYVRGGWFERHMDHAKSLGAAGMFFTVYGYSRKLRGLIRNHMGQNLVSLVDRQHLVMMKDISYVGTYKFNNVDQAFFYHPLKDQQIDIQSIIET